MLLALASSLATSTPVHASDLAQNKIKQLNWLIGKWNFVDSSVSGSYRETGTRDCEYALNSGYIICASEGVTNSGKERKYLFYFNYNHLDERFEITALNSDYPRKNLYVLTPNEDRNILELSNVAWSNDGLSLNNNATITYNGKDQYVWEIRSGDPDPDTGIVPVSYRDVVTRKD